MVCTLPFAIVGIAANVLDPQLFRLGLGTIGVVAGSALLLVGVPIWLTSVVQILVHVPRHQLITGGPFAVVLHPLYTSVALLVIPGLGLVLDTWLGCTLGLILYVFSRMFSRREEQELEDAFAEEYASYRESVLLPCL